MKKKNKVFALLAALFFSVVFSLLFKWLQTGDPFRMDTVMYGSVIFLNILVTAGIAFFFYNKYSKKSSIQLKQKLIPIFILFVLIVLISSLILVSFGVYLFFVFEGLNTSEFLTHLFKVELAGALKQFSIWILIGSVFFFYIIWRKAIDREQLLREENLKYRYKTLKSQLNPHFLFNSLNTLSELVYSDSKKADNFIQKFSGIYRYILENEETLFVPLKNEIEFVRQYFSLQKERDNDKILLEIDIDNISDYEIIPVSLQLLVENVLKHNIMSYNKPLTISISANNSNVIVSNNIQRKNTIENSTRLGLSNLNERLKLIMNKELIVLENNNMFTVKLPVKHRFNEGVDN